MDFDLSFPLQGLGPALARPSRSVPGCCQARLPTAAEAHRAPECVACGGHVGTAADVYGLGQLLLSMLRPWRLRPFAFQELLQVAEGSAVWSERDFGRLAGRLKNASRQGFGRVAKRYAYRRHI